MFQFLGKSDASISSVSRLGKKVEGRSRPRTLLVKLNTEWSVQKLLTKARNLKQYTSSIFMSRMLSPEDHEKEKLVLKKRRELINQGTPAKELKIKHLKLFHNNNEVQLWLFSNHLSVLFYNCQSLISIQRRLKLADYLNIHQPAIVCLTETWLSDCHFDVNFLPNCSYGIISQSMRKSGQHGGVLIAINK